MVGFDNFECRICLASGVDWGKIIVKIGARDYLGIIDCIGDGSAGGGLCGGKEIEGREDEGTSEGHGYYYRYLMLVIESKMTC